MKYVLVILVIVWITVVDHFPLCIVYEIIIILGALVCDPQKGAGADSSEKQGR